MNVKFSDKAKKQFLKLEKQSQTRIQNFVREIKCLENPRKRGKSLTGNFKDFWRYRVGDYRLICQIRDKELLIVVVEIGHRREIYKNFAD